MLLFSCKKPAVTQKEECDSEIEYVQVGFVLDDMFFDPGVSCVDFKAIAKGSSNENMKHGSQKLYEGKKIEDCSVLKTINESLKKNTFDTCKTQSIDVRMKCIIKYKVNCAIGLFHRKQTLYTFRDITEVFNTTDYCSIGLC